TCLANYCWSGPAESRSQQRLLCRHIACCNSNTGGIIAPGGATGSARWLAASGVVGCGRLQPTSSRRGFFFERNRQSVRPLRTATAETEGVSGCESLQLITSSRAQYLTVTNEKSRSGDQKCTNEGSRQFIPDRQTSKLLQK